MRLQYFNSESTEYFGFLTIIAKHRRIDAYSTEILLPLEKFTLLIISNEKSEFIFAGDSMAKIVKEPIFLILSNYLIGYYSPSKNALISADWNEIRPLWIVVKKGKMDVKNRLLFEDRAKRCQVS
ncbi:MAG: hypothetical protein ACPG49_14165, partial [Chitinophagales bacterium]